MPIEVVDLVPGTETPVGDGVNAAVRALVRYPDGSLRAAIVKQMPAESVAAEAFCAILLKGWGLSVPDAAIVRLPLAFASLDVGYPNLKQRVGWSAALPPAAVIALESWGAKLVASFSETPRALAADEAIDNRDRNLGNILWDGTEVAWIDHERSLGVVALPDVNKLAVMALMSGGHVQVQQAAIAISLTLGHQAATDANAECAALPEAAPYAALVAGRLVGLAQRVLARFPQPPGLFGNNGGAP